MPIFWGGCFSGPLPTASAHFHPQKGGWDKRVLLGFLICLGPQIVPKTGQDHRRFLGVLFTPFADRKCGFPPLKGVGTSLFFLVPSPFGGPNCA